VRAEWDWNFAFKILPRLISALKITLIATIVGMGMALILGLLLAILRRSNSKLLSWPSTFFIEFVRSTPLLVQVYFLFYVAPGIGIKLSPLFTGILALGLHYSSYTSEVYRAGIDSIPKGQWEAAIALNLSSPRTLSSIIVPQAIPPIIPALGNYFIAMFKDTPMLSTITVLELLYTAKDIGSETFRYLEPMTMVGVLFLFISIIAAGFIRKLEKKLKLIGT